jgi:hypothetical protein
LKQKTLFLELNEFNASLLQTAAEKLDLPHLKRLCSLAQTSIWTEDTYESDFLEPWVQWVSVHTGVPSSVHKIKHLGDVPRLESKQIWELLSERGITSGVWGAMNASRRNANLCRFFLPDPWTASEDAFPDELNSLLDPVRYLSKNYLNRSSWTLLKKVGKLLKLLFAKGLGPTLLKETIKLPFRLFRYRFKHFVFISLADYLYTCLFLIYRKQENPDFSLLFLNSIAHLQHHHWHGQELTQNEPLTYGFKVLDKILKLLFDSLGENETFVVANALSQKNTNDEKPWILYRQMDQTSFLKTVGIRFERVESHMTHDAHIYFATEQDAQQAKKSLEGARIEGQPLFLVESYSEQPNKLFYRICFTDEVVPDVKFTIHGKDYRFFDSFKPIVQRTGKHIPEGTVFCSRSILPKRLRNHELLSTLLFGSSPKSAERSEKESADQRV